MVRNRAKPNRTAAPASRSTGKPSLAPKGGKLLPGEGKLTFSVWDGKKKVEVDPEEFLRSQGIVRINESDAKPQKVRWSKRAKNLEAKRRIVIESSIISTLRQVESAEERQSIFNSVAADLGLEVPQHSAPTVDVPASASPSSVPTKAPEIYRERSNPAETAEQFLRRAYEPWLAAGCLFQFHIGKLDPTLLQGLKNQFKGKSEELRALLPRKKDEVSQRLAAIVGKEVDDPEQRRALAQAERNMTAALGKLKM